MKTVKPQKSVKSAPKATSLIEAIKSIPFEQGEKDQKIKLEIELDTTSLIFLTEGCIKNGCDLNTGVGAIVYEHCVEWGNGSFSLQGGVREPVITRIDVEPEVGALIVERTKKLGMHLSGYLKRVLNGTLDPMATNASASLVDFRRAKTTKTKRKVVAK